MAAPTSCAENEVLASGGAGTGTTLDTNLANRQVVEILNLGPEPLTVRRSSSGAPSITPGVGWVIHPNTSMEFWAGPGIRFYGRTAATNQSSGAGTWVNEAA